MTALSRLLAGAGRVRVLAAARVRTATAGSTAALRAAATRASALLRAPGPDATRSRSPHWMATVRPAVDHFLQADLLRRTRDSLLRARPLILRARPVLAELRSSFPSTTSLRPALRDLFQGLPRPGALVGVGGDGEEALRRRPLERLPRLRLRRRGPRAARHVEPHGDDVLVVDDDDDRMAAKLDAALRRLCKAFWDAFLDRHRLQTWIFQMIHSTKKTPGPGQRPRRLPLRPARPRTPLLPSSSPLRGPIHGVEPLDWIILANVAAVAQGSDLQLQVHLSAEAPPRPSTLSVSAAISGPFTTYVAAVLDRGHLLLLRAGPDYYLCDIASGTATRLPLPVPGAFLAPDTIAIVSRVDGDGYLVLALRNAPAAGMRTVLSFDSRTWTWSGFAVAVEGVPVGGGDRPWSSSHGVVSHGGRIAWVDLRRGFVLFDAHAQAQERRLRFMSLPTGRVLPAHTTGVGRLRCAALSHGVLRYAELVELDGPHVELWRFDEVDRTWLRGGRVRLDAGLRTDLLPWIAVIHPHKDVVFVNTGSAISAVDVRRGRVIIAEDIFQLPPPELRSSYYVRAWELA